MALGYFQREGIDYYDTYAPVVSMSSIRTIISIAASMDLEMKQFDICTAFLNGELQEEIYIHQPPGYDDGSGRVCKLVKGLYGLKQSPRAWNSKFNQVMMSANFTRSKLDLCVYTKIHGDTFIIMCLYVDDGLIFAKTSAELDYVIELLKSNFGITYGEVSTYVGLEISRNRQERTITLRQIAYTEKKLVQFGMEAAKPVVTPVDTNTVYRRNDPSDGPNSDFPYCQLVGSLIWLSSQTRPDLAFAVSLLSRFMKSPTKAHITAAKRVLRYLVGTKTVGITLGGPLRLKAFSDSDYAGDKDNRQSTTGNIIFCGGPVFWLSQQQSTVALSTSEAEYISLSECARTVKFFINFLHELGIVNPGVPPIYCDNQSACAQANSEAISRGARHIDVCYHHVRNLVQNNIIRIEGISTKDQLADSLTKAVPRAILDFFLGGIYSGPISE